MGARDDAATTNGQEAPTRRRARVALLEEQAASRVPELVPVRYGRMLISPFTFFRGAAYLMASDLAGQPRTALTAQLCGDAHLSNFGAYAGPDRRLVFSINDFDETLPGPFEWDLKRLGASFAVAGRDRGIGTRARAAAVERVSASYRAAMREFAAMRTLDVWYSRIDVDDLLREARRAMPKADVRRFERNVARARAKDSLRAFSKLVEEVEGELRIAADPPLITPVEDVVAGSDVGDVDGFIHRVLRQYRRTLAGDRRHLLERYRYVHAARKVVGVGSVGTRAWIMLMLGRDGGDPLFLQVKEAQASVLEPFVGRSRYASHAQRVVEGQRLMQAASDIMLGWVRMTGVDGVERDFYVRQLWDAKGSAIVETMDAFRLRYYAGVCGEALARAHARSGDPVAIAAYLGRGRAFDRALVAFAEAYADQNEEDYAALVAAVESGRVEAQLGL